MFCSEHLSFTAFKMPAKKLGKQFTEHRHMLSWLEQRAGYILGV